MNEIGEKIKAVMEKEDIWGYQVAQATGILKNNICVILGPKGNNYGILGCVGGGNNGCVLRVAYCTVFPKDVASSK